MNLKKCSKRVLVTGANGFIGQRLLLCLADQGHEVYALVRRQLDIMIPENFAASIHIIQADLLLPSTLAAVPKSIDAAYYLVHSMGDSADFAEMEAVTAKNFVDGISRTDCKQIIYLSGLSNEESLSQHLASRRKVGEILKEGKIPVTILMAGIIVGSGSASFEIIRDLVEKLPIMVAPKWVNQLTQPIAIRDAMKYLIGVLGNQACMEQSFEIGGPSVMSYKELLLRFASVRGLKRRIITVPVLTPRLSSYWLIFITKTSFSLARSLVRSLINNAVCKENRIKEIIPLPLLNYEEAVGLAFRPWESDWMPVNWEETKGGPSLKPAYSVYMHAPKFGVLTETQKIPFSCPTKRVKEKIWSLGGSNGWPAFHWAWSLRGLVDEWVGGVGLRRGRTHPTEIKAGDHIDFWKVLFADPASGRLLLFAEMKLPGEAWLEFRIEPHGTGGTLFQTATFRPKGLWGRCYWYALYPFHKLIFRRLAKFIINDS